MQESTQQTQGTQQPKRKYVEAVCILGLRALLWMEMMLNAAFYIYNAIQTCNDDEFW